MLSELQSKDSDRKVEISVQDGVEIHADPNLLRIAIENLLQNAWKFTSKTTAAMIEFGITEWQGKSVCFIRDNGPGCSQEFAEKIFGPFQRLHTEAEFPGSGIGLAIAKARDREARRFDLGRWRAGRGSNVLLRFTIVKRSAHWPKQY